MHLRSRSAVWRVAAVVVALLAAGTAVVPAHAATGTQRYVSPFGSDTGTCASQAAPCATVGFAVTASAAGDTVNLAPGTYVEQVVVTKNLTIVGAGRDESFIQAPAALVSNSQSVNAIVDITGATTTVSISALTVAGPGASGGGSDCGPNPSSLDKGIDVHAGASLNLSDAAVRSIYNLPVGGCQRGDGISIGTACFSCTPAEVGHATIHDSIVSVYQKNGIAVRGPGSTLTMTDSRITNLPSAVIGSNGIEVVTGAVGRVSGNTVSGNECNLSPVCGPNPFTATEADGVLLFGSDPSTVVNDNTVFGNDMGIYSDDAATVTGNNANNNRDVGIYVDSGAANAQVKGNTASRTSTNTGLYGIITVSGLGNQFADDTAMGNTAFDLDAVISGADTNTYGHNLCRAAYPSRGYWHCS